MKIKKFISRFKKIESQEQNHPLDPITCLGCELYPALFNQHPDGVVLFNTDGKVIDCNEKVMTILGYSLEELQQDFFRYVDDDYVKIVLRNFKKALKGETREYTTVRIKKDGTRFYVQNVLSPIIMGQSVQGIVGIFRDHNEFATIKDHLNRAQQIASIGSWDYFPEEDIVFWSDEVYSLFGIKEKSSFVPTVGKLMNMVHSEDRERFKTTIDNALLKGIGYETEIRIIQIGGKICTCYVKSECFVNRMGKVTKLTGVMQDVTEKKEIKDQIQQRETQMLNLVQSVDAAVWSYDIKNKKILFCSDAVYKIFGRSSEEFVKNVDYWKSSIHPEDVKTVKQVQHLLNKGEKLNHEYRIIDSSGKIRWVEDRTIPTLDEEGNLIRLDGLIIDITDRKNYEVQLDHIASHDFLTGLPNRRKFESEFVKAVETAKRDNRMLSLLIIDLDRFKNVNDALGHAVGDKLLIEVSKRISQVCGNSSFLARMGGDEFAVIIEDITGMDVSIGLSQRIIKKFKEPFFIDDFELYITTSIGITFAPFNGDDAQTLLKNADIAMRRAKEAGRNDYYVYTPSMNIETFKKYSLEKGLYNALKNNEFYLEYQPKVNPKTGRMEGAEALIRWKHPEWGIVSPGEFIPLAEESNFILNIGDWVVEQVCQTLKEWQEKGLKLVPISVNVSYKRFTKTDFLKSIVTIVKKTGIHPSFLEFEITERSMIQNEEVVRSVMAKMQALGFKFSLDDFGTGQSSLSNLSTFEIDCIKIDRSFTQNIGGNKRIESIISSMILLAKDMGMVIVAEGVETEEQLQFLQDRNCHLIQGYLYSRPVGAKQFEQLLQYPVIRSSKKQTERRQAIVERRKHYPIEFPKPMIGEMTITKIKDQYVNMGYSKILIQNISKGGLAFLSQINLPLNEEITLKFTIRISEHTLTLLGLIAWKKEENSIYRYGVKFLPPKKELEYLILLLSQIKDDLERP